MIFLRTVEHLYTSNPIKRTSWTIRKLLYHFPNLPKLHNTETHNVPYYWGIGHRCLSIVTPHRRLRAPWSFDSLVSEFLKRVNVDLPTISFHSHFFKMPSRNKYGSIGPSSWKNYPHGIRVRIAATSVEILRLTGPHCLRFETKKLLRTNLD